LLFSLSFGSSATSRRAATVRIAVEQLVFTPAEVAARVGDPIEWDNKDVLQHTATAKDGSWDVLLPPKKKGSVVVTEPSVSEYYCKFHPNMKAVLTVGPWWRAVTYCVLRGGWTASVS
jgi:plastocyanin